MQLTNISPEFAKALVKMQGEIEGAKKGKKNDHFKSKYADLESCWDACRDALQGNGLAVLQPLSAAPAGYVGVDTIVVFGPTGETIRELYTVPVKDPTNPQAYGSAVTYARRYGLCALIGICPEDDDGNAASAKPKADKAAEQPDKAYLDAVKARLAKTDADDAKAYHSEVRNDFSANDATRSAAMAMIVDFVKSKKGSK